MVDIGQKNCKESGMRKNCVKCMEFFYDKVPRRWRSRLERSPRKRKFGCSNPSRDRPKSQN